MVYRNCTLAREWVLQGHEVTVVAGSFGHIRFRQPKITGRFEEEHIDGIRYLWVRTPVYRPTGTMLRVLAMLAFNLRCMFIGLGKERPYDIVICSSPPPFSIYYGRKLARLWNAKLVFDIRDLWPLSLIDLGGMSRRHPFIRMVQHAEDFACRKADLVTAVPGNCEDYLRSRGLGKGKFLHIGNGIASDHMSAETMPENHATVLDQLRKQDALILGYAGTIGLANAVHSVVEAVAMLPANIHLVIVGDGAYGSRLHDLSRELRIADRIHILPPVNRGQVADILKNIDIAYIGMQNAPVYKLGASFTKLNDYMLAGKPILYAVGDPGNAVERSGCGVLCRPETPDSIAAGIRELAALSPEARREMGEKGRAWCKKHNRVSEHATQILAGLELET